MENRLSNTWTIALVYLVVAFVQTVAQCDEKKCVIKNNILTCENASCTAPYTNQETEKVTSVKLKWNQISVLNTTLNYPRVTEVLDLSYNKITFIEVGVFDRCTNLSRLDLSHNKLKSVNSGSWEGLHLLRELILSSNQLTMLQRGLFPFGIFGELHTLDLSNNLINVIDPSAFSDIQSLRYLLLDGNKIGDGTILSHHFTGLGGLITLNLNHNLMTKIDEDFLHHCERLDQLYIDNNLLELIHISAFRTKDKHKLQYLQKISLKRNKIKSLQPMTFNLPKLEDLYLDGNAFSEISPGYFDGCTASKVSLQGCDHLAVVKNGSFKDVNKLTNIDISNCLMLSKIEKNAFGMKNSAINVANFGSNHLETLPKDILNWDRVKMVDLSHNPWSCDSRISWMKSPDVYPKLSHVDDIKCASPSHLSNYKLSEIHINDFRIWKEHKGQKFVNKTIMLYLALGVTGVLFILGVMALVYYRWRRRPGLSTPQTSDTYQSLYNAVDIDEPTVTIHVPEEKKKLMDEADTVEV